MTEYHTISELAHHFDVSTRTIRYYEELGMLAPERRKNGQRLFTKREKTRLKMIFRGKKYGFQLEEIKEMIQLFDQDPSGVKQLEKTIDYGKLKIEEVETRIEELLMLKQEMTEWVNKFETELSNRKGESNREYF
ncbi:MerR family DNA-binding transcriptional regulator [Thalassobacillus sp. CUG 92003]|uniref:MerR family transcriptional regulator n=1 Tax=Thalassobacillus sp. CUG 92003 TaxID=2736641 RepID=UPI0015E7D0CE|nr:MerR family DNA-binding transcriptional regulator [Thalassobacillus sp. CUG 92003]